MTPAHPKDFQWFNLNLSKIEADESGHCHAVICTWVRHEYNMVVTVFSVLIFVFFPVCH